MCECCENIEFLSKTYKVKVQIISETRHGKCIHKTYKINYCPICGRKLKEDKQ